MIYYFHSNIHDSQFTRMSSEASERRRNQHASPFGGSLKLRNYQESLRVKRSATMPDSEEAKKELELLRRENRQVKCQLATLKQRFTKLEQHADDLLNEKEDIVMKNEEEKQQSVNKLGQYQVAVNLLEGKLQKGELWRAQLGFKSWRKTLIERCSALEFANAQLQAEAQVQRFQYEECLDQVASQVVQAILVQKNQQEQCERLSKQVENLQKQNENLCSMMSAKGGGGFSLSLNHPKRRLHLFSSCSKFNMNSHSLPNTLERTENVCDRIKKTDSSLVKSWQNEEISCHRTNERENPSSEDGRIPLPPPLPPVKTKRLRHPVIPGDQLEATPPKGSSSACWYDIIKSLQQRDDSLPPPSEILDRCRLESSHNMSSDSSMDTEGQPLESQCSAMLNVDNLTTDSSEDEYNVCPRPTSKSSTCLHGTALSPSNNVPVTSQSDCYPHLPSHCSYQSRLQTLNSELFGNPKESVPSSTEQEIVVNCSLIEYNNPSSSNVTSKLEGREAGGRTVSFDSSAYSSPKEKSESSGVSEGITKDEGYSTMSSDVQTGAKDSPKLSKISTVEEEKSKIETEEEISEVSSLELSNNTKNVNLNSTAVTLCNNSQSTEYADGLRVVYDDEDNNSDVIFLPISEEKKFRHSFNVPHNHEPFHLVRSFSDSFLSNLVFQGYSLQSVKNFKRDGFEQATLPSNSSLKKDSSNFFSSNLRKIFRRDSIKSRRLANRHMLPFCKPSSSSMENNCDSNSLSNGLHFRILSPSYSHAEMEDWSLDLSGEDLTTPGENEVSVADSTAPILAPQPSIQETTLDLEEDTSEFLWNGATYFKAHDHELDWHYEKDQNKAWDLNLASKGHSHSMISPKSGCSDQPAIWSSSDQLSCCSDIASKCSTDIENFCDQLCNLPELKRVSFCSSDNGGPESITSMSKLSEAESTEDNSEAAEDIGIETVFTRDFYRLVKFESTKSLAASSKSLAMSEGFLTLDKLQGLDTAQSNKTLASVLGFIAEQQQYCKEREVLDEESLSIICNKINSAASNLSSTRKSFTNFENMANVNNNGDEPKKDLNEEKLLSSSESLSCLNLDSERTSETPSEDEIILPLRPKRSTSLNLGVIRNTFRQRRALPPVPAEDSPPSPPSPSPPSPSPPSPPSLPSRSTSCVRDSCTLSSEASWFSPKIREESFPPPPTYEEIYNETYDALPPTIPPHGLSIPSLPMRSSSMLQHSSKSCESPPVPKRITSRALPQPPTRGSQSLKSDFLPRILPSRTSSLGNAKAIEVQKRRPKSLLKEATVANANAAALKKNRGSCGELGSRTSATLLFELQKMAQAEEDEGCSSKMCSSPEVSSPSQEAGLGTGWVRVEPMTDLNDPQARANLLDSMMHSSEGCTSETDEELAKHLQHNQLFKSAQRSRRRKKVLHPKRPTILSSSSIFSRYGTEEEAALQEFEFLNFIPSKSDESLQFNAGSVEQSFSVAASPYQHSRNKSQVFQMDLNTLRSSEPCYSQEYPLSSIPLPQLHRISQRTNALRRQSKCEKADLSQNATRSKVKLKSRLHLQQDPPALSSSAIDEEFSWLRSYENFQEEPIIDSLLNARTNAFNLPENVDNIKTLKNDCVEFNLYDDSVHHISPYSSIPIRCKVNSIAKTANANVKVSKSVNAGVDTTSLGNIKSVIQKFNGRTKPTHSSKAPCSVSSQSKVAVGNKTNLSMSPKSRITRSDLGRIPLKQKSLNRRLDDDAFSRTNNVKKIEYPIKKYAQSSAKDCYAKQTSLKSPKILQGLRNIYKKVPIKGQPIEDSASSDGGSEIVEGRMSISDSCAEIFSPFESADEVFLQ